MTEKNECMIFPDVLRASSILSQQIRRYDRTWVILVVTRKRRQEKAYTYHFLPRVHSCGCALNKFIQRL